MAALLSQAIKLDPVKDLEDQLNPKYLADEGVKMKAVPVHVKKSIDCLDANISQPLQLRYLLLHAHDHLQSNPELHMQWTEKLHKCGVPKDLIDWDHGLVPSPGSKSFHNWGISSSGRLSASLILPLTEVLRDASHKWREIAESLNLPERVKADLRTAFLIGQSNKICICEVLKAWILGEYEHAKSPTLSNLKRTLASQRVNLGIQASKLESELSKYWENITYRGLKSMSTHQEAKTRSPEIISQSCLVEVHEAKSTLLEVQVVAGHLQISTTIFSWTKDGSLLLDDDDGYIGTNKPVLCIKDTNVASAGTFACKIELRADSQDTVLLQSNPITLTVKLLPTTKILVDKYSLLPKVQRSLWPPVNLNTAIKLVLTKSSTNHFTPKGSIDGFFDEQKVTSLEESFGHYKSGAFLVVKGRHGSGKSTLVNNIVIDWARGKSILMGAKLVFHITNQILSQCEDSNMVDVLRVIYFDHEDEADNVLRYLSSSDGEGVCFILDSLDEYFRKPSFRESVIHKVMAKNYLPRSMIIAAISPEASNSMPKADMCIKIVGFLKEDLHKFVFKYPFMSSSKGPEKLKAYLASHPNVEHSCYLPLHAEFLSFLHDQKRDLPVTETEVFKHLTVLTLKNCGDLDFSGDMEDLTGGSWHGFQKACQVAFETANKKEFVQHDCSDVDSNNAFLAFASVDAENTIFSFAHQSYQSFLAAYHMTQLKLEDQREIFKKFGEEESMQLVWKYYCGLADDTMLQTMFSEILSCGDKLFHCHCAYESQKPDICMPFIACEEKGSLSFKDLAISSADRLCIAYTISNTASVLNDLTMDNCCIGDDISFLSNSLELCDRLQNLDLSHNGIGNAGIKNLASSLCLCTDLARLTLSHNSIGDNGASALASCLKFSTSLEALNLEGNKICDSGIVSICSALSKNDLKVLNLGDNNFSQLGTKAISDCLEKSKHLISLSLPHCKIGADGMASIAKGLMCCPSLESLNLDYNNINDFCLHLMLNSLEQCKNLQIISVASNEITDDGASALFDCLVRLKHLKKLTLSNNFIGDDGAKALTSVLNQSNSFKTLILK